MKKYSVLISKLVLITFFFNMPLSVVNAAEYALISDLGTSARQIALGNVSGFSDSADSVFENPAALYRVDQFSLSLFSMPVNSAFLIKCLLYCEISNKNDARARNDVSQHSGYLEIQSS